MDKMKHCWKPFDTIYLFKLLCYPILLLKLSKINWGIFKGEQSLFVSRHFLNFIHLFLNADSFSSALQVESSKGEEEEGGGGGALFDKFFGRLEKSSKYCCKTGGSNPGALALHWHCIDTALAVLH